MEFNIKNKNIFGEKRLLFVDPEPVKPQKKSPRKSPTSFIVDDSANSLAQEPKDAEKAEVNASDIETKIAEIKTAIEVERKVYNSKELVEFIATKVLAMAESLSEETKAAIKQAIENRLNKIGATKKVDQQIKRIEKQLERSTKSKISNQKKLEILNRITGQIYDLNLSEYAQTDPSIKEFTSKVDLNDFESLSRVGGNGRYAKEQKERAQNSMLQMLEEGVNPAIDKFQDAIAAAYIADVLNENQFETTPKEIGLAIQTYKGGNYKEGKRSARAKEIMDKIKELKDKLSGIRLEYFGTTDAMKYALPKDESWHGEKVETFLKILTFESNQRISSNILFTKKTLTLINEYIKAPDKEEFLSSSPNKNEFIRGGGIFDIATCFQRAENIKMEYEGTPYVFSKLSQDEVVNLRINTSEENEKYRTAGIRFKLKDSLL